LRELFRTKDFIFHDGRDLKRFSVAGRTQAFFAGIATVTVAFSAYGVAQAAVGAIAISGMTAKPGTPEEQMVAMRGQVEAMQADIAAVKQAAAAHAARIAQRQALLSALVSGKTDRKMLSMNLPAVQAPNSPIATEVLEPLRQVENRQLALAVKARRLGETRYAAVAARIRSRGLAPERYLGRMPAMGGPFEPVNAAEITASANADAEFRALFQTWKKLDVLEQSEIAIPSLQPVDNLTFTSNFGVRSDPFRGVAAMHAGVDIPGPKGTPVYATADGIVERSGRYGGYGNLVEINHGRGIETRYGHLSKLLVEANTHVHRGQLIGLMGSTGRSTGPHLHYEVRVDGHAVNPVPFLATATFAAPGTNGSFDQTAMGGPDGD
jgi:murein DD-endopeptidase MepM/ murein hydrolase activator NlpD